MDTPHPQVQGPDDFPLLVRRQGRPLGTRDERGDAFMGAGLANLLGAGVGGDDAAEERRQGVGSLAVAGGAVPGEVVGGGLRGEVLEQDRRVGRAVRLVAVGVAGEVVLEQDR